MRSGGAQGQLTVQCATSNGTATNGVNYTGVTNTLTWDNQDIAVKTISMPTLQDNSVDGTKTVNLSLFNASIVNGNGNSNSLILSSPSNAVLNIEDSDHYGALNFVANNFDVLQNSSAGPDHGHPHRRRDRNRHRSIIRTSATRAPATSALPFSRRWRARILERPPAR